MGPEGFEPPPYRLKGGYAAITPRPQRKRGGRFSRDGMTMAFLAFLRVKRPGLAGHLALWIATKASEVTSAPQELTARIPVARPCLQPESATALSVLGMS